MPESARTLCQADQTPFFDTATEDFSVALLLGGKGLSSASFVPAQGVAASQPAIQASGERSVAAGTISDSTITDNLAPGAWCESGAAGISNRFGTMTIQRSTIARNVNEGSSGGGLSSLFSTHPPIAKRIERLNAMPIEAR